mgnify:CR=1 FL=1
MESPIYSMIDHVQVLRSKRNLLEAQVGLLKSMEYLENYTLLRKKELILKIKLKKTISDLEEEIHEILKQIPKTPGIREIEEKMKDLKSLKSSKSREFHTTIESQLEEIQKKLQELG